MAKGNDLEIWAHRGGGGSKFDENSIESIKNALQSKYKKIELDVWLDDDVLVLSHDQPLNHGRPLLGDALKLIDGKMEIYLDIKHSEAALKVHELVKNQYITHYDSVVFASFEVEALRLIKNKSAAARLGLNYRTVDDHFIDVAQELDVDYIAMNWKRVIPNYFNLKQSRQELNVKYLAYTVNSPALAGIMQRIGMSGIITDCPDKFIASNKPPS